MIYLANPELCLFKLFMHIYNVSLCVFASRSTGMKTKMLLPILYAFIIHKLEALNIYFPYRP